MSKTENPGKIHAAQLILALTEDADGNPYYSGPIDGKWGTLSNAAAQRLLESLVPKTETVAPDVSDSDTAVIPGNDVMVFFLPQDGERYVSEHFKVREFACHDGSPVVLINRKLPDACETARTINGAFSPTSSYRHPAYNASIGGAKNSRHMYGDAVDIPAVKATPEELYALMDPYVGDQGGVGIYDWGVHVDFRGEKARWDSRTKK